MNDTKYTEEEIDPFDTSTGSVLRVNSERSRTIEWAIEELKKKHPERANREQAISLLDTLKELPNFVVNKIAKDRASGKLKPKS